MPSGVIAMATGSLPTGDRRAGGVGGGRDRGHRARAGVDDVGGLAVRRDRDGNGVSCRPVIGGPGVLVAVAIGVTVPSPVDDVGGDRACRPRRRGPGKAVIGAASAAACGAGTTKPSPAASEISTAGMTRHRSTARRAVIVPAGMASHPLGCGPLIPHDATTLSNTQLHIVRTGAAERDRPGGQLLACPPRTRAGARSPDGLVPGSGLERLAQDNPAHRQTISWWCWRRKASMSPTAAPAPAPAASPVRTASRRALARSVPGLAPLAIASSHTVTMNATITTTAAAASVHGQNEIGLHVGRGQAGPRRPYVSGQRGDLPADRVITRCITRNAAAGWRRAGPGRGAVIASSALSSSGLHQRHGEPARALRAGRETVTLADAIGRAVHSRVNTVPARAVCAVVLGASWGQAIRGQ